jgi:hypothetical protein
MPRLMLTLGFAFLSGCATFPEGPSIRALPGTGKTFEEFRAADDACRQHSFEQVQGVRPDLGGTETDQKRAVSETAVAAARGGSMGAGEDAVTESGTGSTMRPDLGAVSARDLQHRYDFAYVDCMYTKGHRVPVSGQVIAPSSQPALPPSDSGSPPSDAYPETPPRDRWYAPPPDFYPVPPSRSYR